MRARTVRFFCPKCWRGRTVAADTAASSCPSCDAEARVEPPLGGALERCAMCGCGDLYAEKDFPARLGCFVIVLAIAGFLVTENALVLLAAAAVDAVLYLVLRDRVICYRCLAEHRGFDAPERVKRYDLGTAGRYAARGPKKPGDAP